MLTPRRETSDILRDSEQDLRHEREREKVGAGQSVEDEGKGGAIAMRLQKNEKRGGGEKSRAAKDGETPSTVKQMEGI